MRHAFAEATIPAARGTADIGSSFGDDAQPKDEMAVSTPMERRESRFTNYLESDGRLSSNAPAKPRRGHTRVMAQPSQINKPFVGFSVR